MPRQEPQSTETQISLESATVGQESRVPGLSLLYHPDLGRIGERAVLLGLAESGEARLSRREPGFSHPGSGDRLPLDHPSLSRRPLRIHREAATGALRLDASATRTRVEADGEAVTVTRTISAGELERGVVLRLGSHVVALLHLLDPLSPPPLPRHGLIGDSAGMARVRREIHKVSDLEVPVLLRGETGSGKELVARAIHDASQRRGEPFVAVNMAALPPALAAAELFGTVRGAYTGAEKSRQGLFAQADGGTLFLDEIGETPPEVQALLLRALETREIRPVGGDATRQVDVRLISATDADLEADIAAERFRAPLLHRLAGFVLQLPPLRERRDDFGRLFLHFLRQELEAVGEGHRLDAAASWLPAEIVARLASHDWPGNVRQLQNVVRQLVITSRGEERARLPETVETLLATARVAPREAPPPSASMEDPPRLKPAEIDDEALVELLRSHRFNVRAAAAAASISPTSLYALIEKSPRLKKPSEIGRTELLASLEGAGGNIDDAALELEVSSLGLKRRMKELGLR